MEPLREAAAALKPILFSSVIVVPFLSTISATRIQYALRDGQSLGFVANWKSTWNSNALHLWRGLPLFVTRQFGTLLCQRFLIRPCRQYIPNSDVAAITADVITTAVFLPIDTLLNVIYTRTDGNISTVDTVQALWNEGTLFSTLYAGVGYVLLGTLLADVCVVALKKALAVPSNQPQPPPASQLARVCAPLLTSAVIAYPFHSLRFVRVFAGPSAVVSGATLFAGIYWSILRPDTLTNLDAVLF